MKEYNYMGRLLFRVLYPPIFGLVVYVIILTIFDSLSELAENFFSQEALFLVITAYILSEISVLFIRLLERFYPFSKNYTFRLFMQILGGLILTFAIVTLCIILYFQLIIGYSDYYTELIVINVVFLMINLLYNLYYFSLYHLDIHKSLILEKERELGKNLEIEMESFKNEINTDLLLICLESLITLVHQDSRKADQYIQKLSKQYRYILDSKRNELVEIKDEIMSAHDLVYLLNFQFSGAIRFEVLPLLKTGIGKIIPGTFNMLIEYAVFNSIIHTSHPLLLELTGDKTDYLVFRYKLNEKLTNGHQKSVNWNRIERAYGYFNDKGLMVKEEDGFRKIYIPVLQITDEG